MNSFSGMCIVFSTTILISLPVNSQEFYSPWKPQSYLEPVWVSQTESALYTSLYPRSEIPTETLSWRGLDPVFAERLRSVFEAAKAAGLQPIFLSGFRPGSYQKTLGSAFKRGQKSGIQYPPAKISHHSMGFAADIQIGRPEKMLAFVNIIHDHGLGFPVNGDSNHIELVTFDGSADEQFISLMTYRGLTEGFIPKLFRYCPICTMRIVPFQSDLEVAERLQNEYRSRIEISQYRAYIRQELRRIKLEKPGLLKSEFDDYRSYFLRDMRFEGPFESTRFDYELTDPLDINWNFTIDWDFDDADN